MIIISLVVDAVMLSALVGLMFSLIAFLLSSLAPAGKARAALISILLVLFEIDWICIWFAALAYLGNGMTSKLEVWTALVVLLIGIIAPIAWLTFARIAVKRGIIKPLLLKLER